MAKENFLDTPVLLLSFNRPDLTKEVFSEIRKARPKQLFLYSDGPRNDEEKKKVDEVRKIFLDIDWNCKVKKLFHEKNVGIAEGIPKAMDWLFDNVEEGIILEDDAIPSQDFFKFCSELLKKYKDDERIMQINGCNFQRGWSRNNYAYYFSKYPHTYGWATWRRARKKYDSQMIGYKELKDKNYFKDLFPDKLERNYIIHIMDDAFYHNPNAIDTKWVFSVMKNNGLCIMPNKNLIQNIGFREDSTHTKKIDSYLSIPISKIDFPLTAPPFMVLDRKSDERYAKWMFWNRIKKHFLLKIKSA
jgi:hypothetical protein